MIAPSPASILADASLAIHSPSHVRSGTTKDGVFWVASYVGQRASFRAEKMLRRELITHDDANALADAASFLTIWELCELARKVA